VGVTGEEVAFEDDPNDVGELEKSFFLSDLMKSLETTLS
jgi:hypothetical protein